MFCHSRKYYLVSFNVSRIRHVIWICTLKLNRKTLLGLASLFHWTTLIIIACCLSKLLIIVKALIFLWMAVWVCLNIDQRNINKITCNKAVKVILLRYPHTRAHVYHMTRAVLKTINEAARPKLNHTWIALLLWLALKLFRYEFSFIQNIELEALDSIIFLRSNNNLFVISGFKITEMR